MSRQRRRACPHCEARRYSPIVRAMPIGNEAEVEDFYAEPGIFFVAGCRVSPGDPMFVCHACARPFGKRVDDEQAAKRMVARRIRAISDRLARGARRLSRHPAPA